MFFLFKYGGGVAGTGMASVLVGFLIVQGNCAYCGAKSRDFLALFFLLSPSPPKNLFFVLSNVVFFFD